MDQEENVEILAARLRATSILGRSDALKKLFDFLVERANDVVAPKEVEVAAAIFGAAANFDVSQDASVRVYIHRLRQKLDEYYDGLGRLETSRLSIPKGTGYRLIVEPMRAELQPLPSPLSGDSESAIRFRPSLKTAIAIVAFFILLNAAVWAAFWPARVQNDYAALRAHSPWAQLLQDARPITLVVGDYYIFGEISKDGSTNRLVREYTVNSPGDLDNFLMQHPDLQDRYMDLGLYYLPVSTASALKSLMPLLGSTAKDRDRIHVVQASDLTPDMIKHTNIIYVGYLSGLGLLREPVFAGSRFSFGDTYDELIDGVGGQHYVSQEGGPDQIDKSLKDFGYISAFTGPNGNHIIIIAGTRDIAVMQIAETASDLKSLDALAQKSNNAPSFEALYEVDGMRRINIGGKLLLASPLKTDRIWNAQPSTLHFPDG